MVRQICTLVSEHFHGFMLQREAEEEQQRLEAEQQQHQQVKAKMLKRLSTPPKSEKSSRTTSRKASQQAEIAAPMEVPLDHALQRFTKDRGQEEQSSNRPHPPYGEDNIMEEIGHHFMAITKKPSHRQHGVRSLKGPNLKRLSTDSSKGRRESNDSIAELLPPIAMGKIAKHDGKVVTQQLEDTKGIKINEKTSDYVVPKGRQRTRILNTQTTAMEVDSLPTSGSKELRPKSTDSNNSGRTVLRTSLLLETMEEGEMETRIDGDGKEAILVQTTMGEKETAIVGSKGSAILLPTSELGTYEAMEQESEAVLQPPAPSTPPPPPPPPAKPERKPWPGGAVDCDITRVIIDLIPYIVLQKWEGQ